MNSSVRFFCTHTYTHARTETRTHAQCQKRPLLLKGAASYKEGLVSPGWPNCSSFPMLQDISSFIGNIRKYQKPFPLSPDGLS